MASMNATDVFFEEWNTNHQELPNQSCFQDNHFLQPSNFVPDQNQHDVKETLIEHLSVLNTASTNPKSSLFSQENSILAEQDFFSSGSDDFPNLHESRKKLESALYHINNLNPGNSNNVISFQSPTNTNLIQSIQNINQQESSYQKLDVNRYFSPAITSPTSSHTMEIESVSDVSTLSKGNPQNPKRNMPVLVFQRPIASCKEVLKPTSNHHGRLTYIQNILNLYFSSNEEKKGFFTFLNSLEFGNKRTWKVIKDQLDGKYVLYVHVLLECTESFLSDAGSEDFENWLSTGKKMKAENKKLLRENKDWFKEQFEIIHKDYQHFNFNFNFDF